MVAAVETETVEISEDQLIQGFAHAKQRFMRDPARYPELALEGARHFNDFWNGHRAQLEAHPKVLEVFAQTVREVADACSQGINDMPEDSGGYVRNDLQALQRKVELARSMAPFHERSAPAAEPERSATPAPEAPSPSSTAAPAGATTIIINVNAGGQVFVGQGWAEGVKATAQPGHQR